MKSLMAVWLVEVAQNELCPTQFSAIAHIPRGHLHQQHLGDDVQEGLLWDRRAHLSGGHQVRPAIRRRLLEQQQAYYVAVLVAHDDQLGDRCGRLLPAANGKKGFFKENYFKILFRWDNIQFVKKNEVIFIILIHPSNI